MTHVLAKLGLWIFVVTAPVSWSFGTGRLMEGGSWKYDIFMGGKRVGTSRITSSAVGADRLETTSELHFELVRGVQKIGVDIAARTIYSWPGGKPLQYELTLSSGRVPAIFSGSFKDGEAVIQMKSGPQKFEDRIQIQGNEYLLDNNFLIEHYLVMLAGIRLEKDQTHEIRFIVPQIAQRFPRVFHMQLRSLGSEGTQWRNRKRNLLRWESIDDAGLKMDFWLDPEDRSLVRWVVPSQMTEMILAGSGEDEPAAAANR